MLITNDYDYYAEYDNLIINTPKITEITISDDKLHPIVTKENLITMPQKNVRPYMQLDTFSNLVPSGSQPGKIYGLAKVLKESTPI